MSPSTVRPQLRLAQREGVVRTGSPQTQTWPPLAQIPDKEFSVVMEQPSTVSLGKHRQRGCRQVDNHDGMLAMVNPSWS